MTSTSTSPLPTVLAKESWAAVVSLGLGIFAIVMSEFLPASLLPSISRDLGVTVGAAGQAVTVTALAAAAAALTISAIFPSTDRRRVMIGLTGLAIVSNLIVAVAPNLGVLLGARVLLGFALGGFWAMATAMVAHLVRAERVGRALTVVNAGVALATIAAIPLAALLVGVWGWRGVFLLGAVIAAIALVIQAVSLPRVTPTPGNGLRALGHTLRSGVVVAGLVAVLLVFGGHFTGYTYIREIVDTVTRVNPEGFALMLLVFGIANVLGTAVSGPLADRSIRVGVILFPAIVSAGMLSLLVTAGNTTGLLIAAALWGFGFGGVPTSVLTWGARVEPTRLEQIGGLIVTVCNIAIAGGAVLGGLLVDNLAAGTPLMVGGAVSIAGGALMATLRVRR